MTRKTQARGRRIGWVGALGLLGALGGVACEPSTARAPKPKEPVLATAIGENVPEFLRSANSPAAQKSTPVTPQSEAAPSSPKTSRPEPPRLPPIPNGLPGGGASLAMDCGLRYLLAQVHADADLLVSCFDVRTQLRFDRDLRKLLQADLEAKALKGFEILGVVPLDGTRRPTQEIRFRYWWPNGEIGEAAIRVENIGTPEAPRWCVVTE